MARAQRRNRNPNQPDELEAARAEQQLALHAVDRDEYTPDLDDVLDRDVPEVYGGVCVDVNVVGTDGPMPVKTVGLSLGGTGTFVLPGGPDFTVKRLVNLDPRRARVWIAVTAATRIAGDQASLTNAQTSFRHIAAYGLIPFGAIDELWVRGDTTQATITYLVEQWAQ